MTAPYREATEAELMVLVTELAAIYGWKWAHFRPARTLHGWVTPASGPLGAGWPDLVLVRARDKRTIYAELKSEHGRLSDEQSVVLGFLGTIAEVHIWRPGMFDEIQAALR